MIRKKEQILGITLVCYHTKTDVRIIHYEQTKWGQSLCFLCVAHYKHWGKNQQSSNPVYQTENTRVCNAITFSEINSVYRLLKGFSVMKDIGNILVIHLHSLLFINSFFTIGWALQRRMNERSLKELSFFLNSCSFSNIVIYASLPTLKSCPHKLEPCWLLKQSVANVKRSLYGKVSLSFLGNSQLVIYY